MNKFRVKQQINTQTQKTRYAIQKLVIGFGGYPTWVTWVTQADLDKFTWKTAAQPEVDKLNELHGWEDVEDESTT